MRQPVGREAEPVSPMTHSIRLMPTDPVAAKMLEGVEKMPVPIILLRIKKTAPVMPSLRESS